MQTVGIVGAGLIGCSWANVFARSGWKVRVWDPIESQRASAFQKIAGSLHDLAAVGLVGDAAEAQARVEIVATLDQALDGVSYVQESGPERLDLKIEVFQRMDAVADPSTILASSTSAIVASQFTESLAGRSRCLVAHPVNPPSGARRGTLRGALDQF